jgi:SagB-type dehydrogenase family enzyme
LKLQSAACQIAYWEDDGLRIANYLTRRTFASRPVTLELIRFFLAPRTIKDALTAFQVYSQASVGRAILKLIAGELLLQPGSAEWARDRLLSSSWKAWLPEGAFHFMTKDAAYMRADWPLWRRLKLLPTTPAPPNFKTIPKAQVIRLPSQQTGSDSFFQTLHARRTHREFAPAALSLPEVSTLLHMTWGVQGYLDAGAYGLLPYKTSPSGGARHPGEVYLMALRVDGLERGIYHYQARNHRLARLPAAATPRIAAAYCAHQPYFGKAAALFIMTAVIARTMWKYGKARAYRLVLLEAGHLCQTFCLTATRLGLAPFSTAALKDSLIENDLGLDGISESVLYIAGVGPIAVTGNPSTGAAGG